MATDGSIERRRIADLTGRERTGAEARAPHDGELWRLPRLWMANRGVWEAMEWAGPSVSVPARRTRTWTTTTRCSASW
jgi:hypothetical protein